MVWTVLVLSLIHIYPDYHGTFKVYTRRAKKSYPVNSMEVSARIGESILDAFPEAKVDVHQPELTVSVEIREKIYVYSKSIKAVSYTHLQAELPTGFPGSLSYLWQAHKESGSHLSLIHI